MIVLYCSKLILKDFFWRWIAVVVEKANIAASKRCKFGLSLDMLWGLLEKSGWEIIPQLSSCAVRLAGCSYRFSWCCHARWVRIASHLLFAGGRIWTWHYFSNFGIGSDNISLTSIFSSWSRLMNNIPSSSVATDICKYGRSTSLWDWINHILVGPRYCY